MRCHDGAPLPGFLFAQIERELVRLELVLTQIAEIERARDERLSTEPVCSRTERKMQTLIRLKGIGPETATLLGTEVFYRDFRNRREIAAFVGLTPAPFRSGALNRDQGISKAGNALVRTAMVELAWFWLRYQPGSDLAKWFVKRTRESGTRAKRVAIVGLARKLLVALWRFVEHGVVPQGAIMKR